ncbi:MAG: trypsin-like peptidase domain-containing protein [Planctomycetota bacterium]
MSGSQRAIESGPAFGWLPLLLLVVAVAAGAFAAAKFLGADEVPDHGLKAVTARGDLASSEKTIIEIFDRGRRSVVSVATARVVRVSPRFGESRTVDTPDGAGTGIVWDRDGHIVTNYHVIEATGSSRRGIPAPVQDKITVHLPGFREPVTARVTGVAPEYDLAVLKVDINAAKLFPIAIGESSSLKVGQTAVAIGNPFGLPHTLTTGVISGLGRQIKSQTDRVIEEVIQTDADINKGNSGGPLLDSAGRLIGVNTAIASTNSRSPGIGFAIPVDTVNWVVAQLIGHGELKRVQLGINAIATSMLRPMPKMAGIYVAGVIEGSPADRAGLQGTVMDRQRRVTRDGDIITHVNGTRVLSNSQLFSALEMASQDGRLDLKVWRRGKSLERSVEL